MISPAHIALMTALQVEASRPQPPVTEIAGRATAISADTIELRGERIQLAGIAGPGLRQTCELKGAPRRCGEHSAQQLRDAIQGEFVVCDHLEVNAAGVKVGRCWLIIPGVPSAPDLNLSRFMVQSGWAWTTPLSEYASDEEYARRSRLGLWSDPEPVEGLVR